ncbi:MAG: hypothetical protein MR665_10180 [Selenomonas bovis]|nr:hypothetical protein [Selenomonas bovis]
MKQIEVVAAAIVKNGKSGNRTSFKKGHLMKKYVKASVATVLMVLALSSIAEAKTIVHYERTAGRGPVSQTSNQAKASTESHNTNESLQTNHDDDEFEQVKMENKDDNQTKDEGNGIEHSEESRLLPNLVKQKDNKNKISVEGYTLEITKPHIDTDNGIISYTRKYTATHEQYGPFTFVLTRARTTAAIASYYYLFFNLIWSDKFEPLFNKNHQPQIIIEQKNGTKISHKVKRIRWTDSYFQFDSVKFIDKVNKNTSKVHLQIYEYDGTELMIPIPVEVIEEWHQDLNANLRELKKEFDNK